MTGASVDISPRALAAAQDVVAPIQTMCEAGGPLWAYAVAGAALATLPDDVFDSLVARHVEDRRFGDPIPPWDSLIDDAAWWAGNATLAELEAYALACFNAMPPARQVAFLDHVIRKRRRAA